MGSYNAEWYGFEVKSRRHLMDLYIEPSFTPAICLQFHEMPDGGYRAFYNYQPARKEEVEEVKAYAQKMDPSTKVNVAYSIAAEADVFRQLAPIFDYVLDDEERRFVDELYVNELPVTDEHHLGLDGHSYKVWIYKGGGEKYYETWCVTPHNWGALRDLVRTIVDRLGLDYKRYGAYISNS